MRYSAILLCTLMPAATVDRLAIAVGSTVITELQIDEDLRVAALLNGQPISRDTESRRAAADRLVEQLLIQHEIELSRYPLPSDEEVSTVYSSIEQTLGGAERTRELLDKYTVSLATLRAHLKAQLTTLRFIEFRFRPDVNISDHDVDEAYRRQVSALHEADASATPPALDVKQRAKISQDLLEERTDAALNSWLAESRKQINIVYIDSSLQ
jgi:parvulin-like peptidyl-prolyl isomerase